MKHGSKTINWQKPKWLRTAQFVALTNCLLGLMFAWHPTPATLFLFTTLAPLLVSTAGTMLVKEWIAANQRQPAQREAVQRAGIPYPITKAG